MSDDADFYDEDEYDVFRRKDKWLDQVSPDEKRRILSVMPQEESLELEYIAQWLRSTPEDRVLARKILQEALRRARARKAILSEHFVLMKLIEIWYRDRETVPEALDEAIQACEAQIGIAVETAAAFRRENPSQLNPVPIEHTGYKQLLIIYKKQHRYDEAIALLQDMQRTGWATDISAQVDSIEKKRAQPAKKDRAKSYDETIAQLLDLQRRGLVNDVSKQVAELESKKSKLAKSK